MLQMSNIHMSTLSTHTHSEKEMCPMVETPLPESFTFDGPQAKVKEGLPNQQAQADNDTPLQLAPSSSIEESSASPQGGLGEKNVLASGGEDDAFSPAAPRIDEDEEA